VLRFCSTQVREGDRRAWRGGDLLPVTVASSTSSGARRKGSWAEWAGRPGWLAR
jgi:hypothetical protein